MSDRELLEKAAKAAGIDVVRSRLDDPVHRDMLARNSSRNPHHEYGAWNPLTDDGDALRLAVKLRIKFRYNEALGQGLAWVNGNDSEARANIEDCGRDEYACARLAIVRAAAALAGDTGAES